MNLENKWKFFIYPFKSTGKLGFMNFWTTYCLIENQSNQCSFIDVENSNFKISCSKTGEKIHSNDHLQISTPSFACIFSNVFEQLILKWKFSTSIKLHWFYSFSSMENPPDTRRRGTLLETLDRQLEPGSNPLSRSCHWNWWKRCSFSVQNHIVEQLKIMKKFENVKYPLFFPLILNSWFLRLNIVQL